MVQEYIEYAYGKNGVTIHPYETIMQINKDLPDPLKEMVYSFQNRIPLVCSVLSQVRESHQPKEE